MTKLVKAGLREAFAEWWWSLAQMPQYALLNSVEPPEHPIYGRLRVCSRTGYCIETSGAGEARRAYAPVEHKYLVVWVWSPEVSLPGGSRSLFPRRLFRIQRLPVVLESVVRPRLLYLEPLAIRAIRLGEGVIEASLGCIEAPGEAYVFACPSGTCRVVVRGGRASIEGVGFASRVSRCSRGLFASFSQTLVSRGRVVLEVRGSVVPVSIRGDARSLEVVLWNPHLHPARVEFKLDARILSCRVCEATGCSSVSVFADEALVSIGGESLATVRFELRPLPKLLAKTRPG